MTITSFSFLVLITVGAGVYYIFPKAFQWVELLVLSMIFYYYAATPYTIIYLAVSTLIAYISTITIQKAKEKDDHKQTVSLIITIIANIINVLIWFVVKGKGLWGFFAQNLIDHVYISKVDTLINLQLIAALGMGYYTLQIIGYVLDCYWDNVEPQKNPLKLFLFTAYFPQLTTGPISRYAQLGGYYTRNISFSIRILRLERKEFFGDL